MSYNMQQVSESVGPVPLIDRRVGQYALDQLKRGYFFTTEAGDKCVLLHQTSFSYKISDQLYRWLRGVDSRQPLGLQRELEFLQRLGFFPQESSDNRRFDSSLKGIVLNLFNGCNMNCVYCCVGPKGSYNKSTTKMMEPDLAKKSIDFLVENSRSKILTVYFFGGEPLINWKTIKNVLEYSSSFRSKDWVYILVTNGTLINDEIARTLADYSVRTNVTIDGSPEVHNKQRPMSNGKPSFDLICDNIARLKNHGAHFHLKCVYTKDFPMSYEELCERMERLTGGNGEYTVVHEHSSLADPKVKEQYYGIAMEKSVLEKKMLLDGVERNPTGSLVQTVARLLMGSRGNVNMCEAGQDTVEIDPEGNFHVCHIADSLGTLRIGNVQTGFSPEYRKMLERFNAPRKSCRTCWAYELCSKECNIPRHMLSEKGIETDVDPVGCNAEQSIIRDGLEVILGINERGIRLLTRACRPEDQNKVIGAYNIRQKLWGALSHIKPCFLFPVNSDYNPIPMQSIPA